MELRLHRMASPLGRLLLVTDERGALRALDFEDYAERMRELLRRHYGTCELSKGSAPASLLDRLQAYFAGKLYAIEEVPVACGGTEFQRRVWAALREIPAGTTISYGALAQKLGSPGASRAVGTANGRNPIAIVVPCHRVIGQNGTLTGYAGGVERKRWLLDHERRSHGPDTRAPTRAS